MNTNWIIAIDIGNSRIAIGLFNKSKLIDKFNIKTNYQTINKEFGDTIIKILKRNNIKNLPTNAVICSVVPDLTQKIIYYLKKNNIKEIKEVTAKLDLNMPILIDNKDELGSDRIVNSYIAYSRFKKAIIVVDFGTATTFDIIDSNGIYLGGIICCGINLCLNALIENTAKLPNIKLIPPTELIGKNTNDAMLSGIINGQGKMTDGLIEAINKHYAINHEVIATGGLASIMHNVCNNIDRVDTNLTIYGLDKIYNNILTK